MAGKIIDRRTLLIGAGFACTAASLGVGRVIAAVTASESATTPKKGTVSILAGAVDRPVADKLADEINVFDVMPVALVAAIRAGAIVDLSHWLNIATGASAQHIGNLTHLKRVIRVSAAPGGYKLGGNNTTVYLRKGQTLDCGSMGAVYFDMSAATNNSKPVIMCGQGADGSIDPGGLAVEIAGGFWLGGPASAPVISMSTPSGYLIRDAFMTSPGIGVLMGGGDGRLSRCQFDQGLTGVVFGGQNNIIENCSFYLMNTQVRCDSAIDCEINNCHFEYARRTSIQLGSGSGQQISALTIRGNSFTANEQYQTFTGFITVACNASKIDIIGGNTFKNGRGFAVSHQTGVGNKVLIDDAVFDGSRSNKVYAQSTTMGGVDGSNQDTTIRSCTFRNLPGQPILHGGTFDAQTIISNNRFDANTGGHSEVLITGVNRGGTARAVLTGNITSGRSLYNSQAAVPVLAAANF